MLDNVLEGCNFMMPYIGIRHWLLGDAMYGDKTLCIAARMGITWSQT